MPELRAFTASAASLFTHGVGREAVVLGVVARVGALSHALQRTAQLLRTLSSLPIEELCSQYDDGTLVHLVNLWTRVIPPAQSVVWHGIVWYGRCL